MQTQMEILWIVGVVVWTLVGLALLAAMVYSYHLARELRQFLGQWNEALDRVNERFDPMMDRVEKITDDASEISDSLRRDIDEIESVVDQGSESARRIARITENRIAEFDALLEVAQEEAESSFLSAASLVGGVRDLRDRLFRRR